MADISYCLLSLLYLIILMLVYFIKKKIKSVENNIFSRILIITFIGLITQILCYYLILFGIETTSNIYFIINKIILLYYIIWSTLFAYYVSFLSRRNQKTKEIQYKKSKIYITISIAILCCVTAFLPLNISIINNLYIPTGPAVEFTYVVSGISIFIMILFLISDHKNFKDKLYIPLYVLIVLGTLCIILQYNNPDLLLLTPLHVIVCYAMFFTIENPDVKMIAQLNEAKAQAEKANNAKSEFLSSMSHEIRTPLNAIVGFSQALSEENLSDEAREEVRDIISASNTLLDIVNGILDISKIEANKLEIINKEYSFKDVFDELVALTKGRLGEKPLDFKYIYDESIPSVLYGDSVRVKQIILNLLTNSVKYTKEGSITFTVNSVKKDDIIRLIVSVEDTGIGIKEENIGKLFTKFERFDEKNTTIEGTGLGLAITKQLVELMNGKIVVQSIHGKGSKFTVAIDQKIVHGKVIETKTSDEDIVEFDLSGKKVLIVDDNNLNLKVASRLIKNYKCDITTVTSGIDCIDKINNNEVFDLILMDDMMPRMSGGETLIRLKKIEGFNIPVVALTANAVTGMREKYLALGFDDYLAKPIEKGELNRVLHKFLKED